MAGKVAVVTGASRGLGRGVARALGNAGFKVYVTGRTNADLHAAADEVTDVGGKGVAVLCDHADDDQVKELFDQVKADDGRLDILVNNATIVNADTLVAPGAFWEKSLVLADTFNVGLRSTYVSSYYAAPLMIATGGALIANISYYGAVSYHYGAAYGATKAGTDKMSFDMAIDLREHDVASVSIWPGPLLTEAVKSIPPEYMTPELALQIADFESPEFTGLVIERLWQDPARMKNSGQSLISAELALRYGIKDLDGKQPKLYISTLGSPVNRFIDSST
ncbi:SDR family NAD(P)-dependent oxidoreductase [Xanthomonas arboricola]|uniref:SDR family NAD(P)-dependent oxidoreductase n=1 Tax=Xanthomonas arboricola TaxID=56448 RepID=UPI00143185C5|nr:SDR family NAD(P)-dependent oxidoreductase [Xanthomonas arboricola]NJB77635.1 NAD(P)-dependent dehydrogenase (short-subunit alcohol dehydrogenase family) [Xanthomonas arboricola]